MAGHLPAEDQLDEEHAVTPLRGAGLPMALHRGPAYSRGLLLAGDSAGTVNPFNGEGISYAMETGRLAAETAVDALAAPEGPQREAVLRRYPDRLRCRVRPAPPARHGFLALLTGRTSSGSPRRTGSSDPSSSRRAAADGQPDRRPRRRPRRPCHRRAHPTDAGGVTVVDITPRIQADTEREYDACTGT